MTFFEIENINKHLADIPTRHSILCPYCLITEIFFMKKKCGEIDPALDSGTEKRGHSGKNWQNPNQVWSLVKSLKSHVGFLVVTNVPR